MFDSSIRENLKLARPGADDAELLEALRRARLDDWVASLPDGLDARGGGRGDALGRPAPAPRPGEGAARERSGAAPGRADGSPRRATAEELVADVLDAADERSVLLITHRPEGLHLVDAVVTVPEPV